MIVDRTPPLTGSVLDGTKNTTQADKDAQVNALYYSFIAFCFINRLCTGLSGFKFPKCCMSEGILILIVYNL